MKLNDTKYVSLDKEVWKKKPRAMSLPDINLKTYTIM